MKKFFALTILIIVVLSACASPVPAPTATIAPTLTSIPPTSLPTNTPKPTPVPFTATLSSGIWDGSGTINNNGEIQISFIVDGTAVSRWQVSLNYCSQAIGDSQDIIIENGVFSFTFDNPCTPGETVTFNGVFVSATEIAGTIQASPDSGEWSAKFSN